MYHANTYVQAQCDRFVEACCDTATTDLGFGDMVAHGDDWMITKIMACIISGGLLIFVYPDMFRFKPPPRSWVTRGSTQRRISPEVIVCET